MSDDESTALEDTPQWAAMVRWAEATTATLADVPCSKCGVVGRLRLEIRRFLVAKPFGTFSLAGQQLKVVATERPWPWMVCDGCGRESRGKMEDE